MDEDRNMLKLVKARELAGQSDLLFLRNSQTGAVECRTNRSAIELNSTLHSHN
jgi:2,3,4,5-tetrahydropyridine-2-carboxylate N-succinyltransferase